MDQNIEPDNNYLAYLSFCEQLSDFQSFQMVITTVSSAVKGGGGGYSIPGILMTVRPGAGGWGATGSHSQNGPETTGNNGRTQGNQGQGKVRVFILQVCRLLIRFSKGAYFLRGQRTHN